MTFKIQSGGVIATIKSLGAELISLINSDGQELLWQGDPQYWDGQSPILFPFTGRSWGDAIRVDGKSYPMRKHGLVSDMEFVPVSLSFDSVTLSLESNEETLQAFPFAFRLEITYTIKDNSLMVERKVINPSTTNTMYFMMGAHPAFNLPDFCPADEVHGYLSTPNAAAFLSHRVLPDGFCHPETEKIVLNENMLALGNHTFDCDTILDQTEVFKQITLLNKVQKPILSVEFDAPVIAIWAPNGGCAPFVCIEPWNGICDKPNNPIELSKRDHIIAVEKEKEWTNTYSVKLF